MSIHHHPPTLPPRASAAPILVTGSHRSGSTWVGRVLASGRKVFYIHEPLKPSLAPHFLEAADLPFYLKITPAQEAPLKAAFDRLLSGRFPRLDPRGFLRRRYFLTRFLHTFTFRWAALRGKRFLLKDPFALFNVGWLEDHFGIRTVLLLRHPCAFVASLKVKDWAFDFTHWTAQPRLLETFSADEAAAVRRTAAQPPDLIDQGCLLWNCLTRRIVHLAAAKPQRVLARHEDLCQHPLDGFRRLFDQLDLSWTPATERLLKSEGGSRRKTDAILHSWKERLSPEEIRRVLNATAELRKRHYPDFP